MRLAKKYAIPGELALLYDFLNSADLRSYVEQGQQHLPLDELDTPARLESWMRDRGLLQAGASITSADHRRAIELRAALRSFLQAPPGSEQSARGRAERLDRISSSYPLLVRIGRKGTPELQSGDLANRLAEVLAEFLALAANGRLDRLKMCSSEECHWVFYDRSKPGNRRWCSSLICGNRQKTRDYRQRQKSERA